jgi:hypothetical protein
VTGAPAVEVTVAVNCTDDWAATFGVVPVKVIVVAANCGPPPDDPLVVPHPTAKLTTQTIDKLNAGRYWRHPGSRSTKAAIPAAALSSHHPPPGASRDTKNSFAGRKAAAGEGASVDTDRVVSAAAELLKATGLDEKAQVDPIGNVPPPGQDIVTELVYVVKGVIVN